MAQVDEGTVFKVEDNKSGGYTDLFTFEDACKVADEDSRQYSSYMTVRHQYEYTPRRIYFCGDLYEMIKKGD